MDVPEPEPLRAWEDVGEAEARERALAGKSLLVLGSPGVGKTFWVRELVKELRTRHRVDVICKCHASARNFGENAVTADHWVRKTIRNGRCPCKTLVIEEISQISCYLWSDIAKAAFTGIQLILLGDFAQLDPILDGWCGAAVPDGALQRSDLLFELSDGARLTLRENRRSDETLFVFYAGLLAGTPEQRDLQEALREARERFPAQAGMPQTTLVLSHSRRMLINRIQNGALKPPDAVLYRAKAGRRGENQSQNMFVYPGQTLIGAGGKVRKGLFCTVLAATEEHLTLDDGQVLTAACASKCLRLAHAITYAACQGLTLQGRVRLDETSHPAFSVKHLYVGSSRATAASLLEVA